MIKFLIYTLITCTTVIVAAPSTTTPVNIYDNSVTAYMLTPDQEKQFNANDTTASPFWNIWDTYPDRFDYVKIDPILDGGKHVQSRSAYGFADTNDARMTCRFAWGKKGLYCYLKMYDDVFVDIIDPQSLYSNDAVEFILEKHALSDIYQGALWINAGELTQDFKQFQCLYGKTEPITFFNRIYWSGTGQNNIAKQWSFADAKKELNIEIKIYTVSSWEKIQEWRLPWSEIGRAGIDIPKVGQQIGLCLFYNDLDGLDDRADLLIWNQGSPYGARNGNGWNALEFGPKLNVKVKKK